MFLYRKYYENLTKMTKQISKSGVFLSRSHIGRDSGFSSPDEIRLVGQSTVKPGQPFQSRIKFEVDCCNIDYIIRLDNLLSVSSRIELIQNKPPRFASPEYTQQKGASKKKTVNTLI